MANNAMFGGSTDVAGGDKVIRLIQLCDTFHLPIVNFVDQPGFMIGPDAERAGTIRYGMAAVAAAVQATVPWASIQVHKGFGVATAAHFGDEAYVLAWPSVESGALPLEGGVAVAFHREIAAAEDPGAKRREIEEWIDLTPAMRGEIMAALPARLETVERRPRRETRRARLARERDGKA